MGGKAGSENPIVDPLRGVTAFVYFRMFLLVVGANNSFTIKMYSQIQNSS